MFVILILFVSLALSAAKKDINEDFLSFADDPNNEDIGEANKNLRKMLQERENFTSCPEFLNNTKLDINKIMEIEWQIFFYYIDTNMIITVPHVFIFRLPDPTLIHRFQTEMNHTIPNMVDFFNWTAAELFLETNVDFSAVLLASNRSGMYDTIPSMLFEGKQYTDDDYHIGLKFLEPHFLGYMNCEWRQLFVLAPVDKMPKQDEEHKMATLFNFRSDLGIPLSEMTKILKKEETQATGLINEEDDRDMNLIYEDEDQQEMMNMI